MPSGLMPTYRYRPTSISSDASMKTRSTRRARLFAGGTYFRAREPGGSGNKISVEMQEWISELAGEEGLRKGKLIVTNHNTVQHENVSGPVDVEVLDQQLNWNERYTIQTINGNTHAILYSISLQIAVGVILEADLGPFSFSDLFHVPGKLSVKLTPKSPEYSASSVITIKPRTRVYDLVIGAPPPPTGAEGGAAPVEPGWDIEALRVQVNASDPWIEMLPRSGTPVNPPLGAPPPPAVKYDEQDDGVDDLYLSAFADTYLSGGDGLPLSPGGERTGPTRSIVYVNYGEKPNGSLAEVNEVYEWVGDSATNGEWRRY